MRTNAVYMTLSGLRISSLRCGGDRCRVTFRRRGNAAKMPSLLVLEWTQNRSSSPAFRWSKKRVSTRALDLLASSRMSWRERNSTPAAQNQRTIYVAFMTAEDLRSFQSEESGVPPPKNKSRSFKACALSQNVALLTPDTGYQGLLINSRHESMFPASGRLGERASGF